MLPLPATACPVPGLPPGHVVDPADVADFLVDSDLQDPLYFVATPAVTNVVKQHGADFDKVLPTKPLTGWWLKKSPEQLPGYHDTPVAVNASHPFVKDLHGLHQMADQLPPPPGGWPNALVKQQALRKYLLDAGYDHVLVTDTDEVVVLKAAAYKVVGQKSPAPPAAPHLAPVPSPGTVVDYAPATVGSVAVGTLLKTPGGTGPVTEMKGKAWAKVQGASPAWHKVDTTQLVLQKAAPPPPQWVPAVAGTLKVGDLVKTGQGNATVTGFQGKAWASVEASVAGNKVKKWQPVKELQVPGPGQAGASAPPPSPTASPADVQKAALAKAKADAAMVGPAGHGLEPGVTEIHDSTTGKTGTVGFVSALGFTLNYDDGTVGSGTWPQFSAGVKGVAKTGSLAQPAPLPAPAPLSPPSLGYSTTYVDKSGHPLSTGDPVTWAGEAGHVAGMGVAPGTIKFKSAAGDVFDVPAKQLASSLATAPQKPQWVPATPGQVKVGSQVMTPTGLAVVTEMQGKAWAALETPGGQKITPKWQKVASLQVEGLPTGPVVVDQHGAQMYPGAKITIGGGAPAELVGPGATAGHVTISIANADFDVPTNTVTLVSNPTAAPAAPTASKIAKLQQEAPPGTVFEHVHQDAAWANEQARRVQQLSTEERGLLNAYTGSAYDAWNTLLRSTRGDESRVPPQYASRFKKLDSAMATTATDRPVQVFRGVHMQRDFSQLIGGYWTDEGYMSTSVDPNRAFGGNVKFVINVPAGTPAVYVYSLSNVKSEKELLLGRGQTLRIISVKRSASGHQQVTAELVPPDSVPEHVKKRG